MEFIVKNLDRPRTRPVTLMRAKRYIGVQHTHEDYLISEYIAAATQYAELVTRDVFINRLCELMVPSLQVRTLELKPSPVYKILEIRVVD